MQSGIINSVTVKTGRMMTMNCALTNRKTIIRYPGQGSGSSGSERVAI